MAAASASSLGSRCLLPCAAGAVGPGIMGVPTRPRGRSACPRLVTSLPRPCAAVSGALIVRIPWPWWPWGWNRPRLRYPRSAGAHGAPAFRSVTPRPRGGVGGSSLSILTRCPSPVNPLVSRSRCPAVMLPPQGFLPFRRIVTDRTRGRRPRRSGSGAVLVTAPLEKRLISVGFRV